MRATVLTLSGALVLTALAPVAASAAAPPSGRAASVGVPSAKSAGSAAAVQRTPARQSDFNGDGYGDLSIGVPGESRDRVRLASGAVQVLYGSARGLTAAADDFWTQDSPSVLGHDDYADRFGEAIAAADFNNDGYCDLAISAPGETVAQQEHAGEVHVLFGTRNGLTGVSDQWLTVETALRPLVAGARFGTVLAAGDFDHDGYADLAASAPGDTADGVARTGSVTVFRGGPKRLRITGIRTLTRATLGLGAGGGGLGLGLTTGDLDGDAYADLVVGAPLDSVGGVPQAGVAVAVYGGTAGLDASTRQHWSQNSPGIWDGADAYGPKGGPTSQFEHFGEHMTTGDFDADGRDDLAVGVPLECTGPCPYLSDSSGSVNVIYGSATGLTSTGNELWSLKTPGVKGIPRGDRLGTSLAGGDVDHDGFADLAVGEPFRSLGTSSTVRAGGVLVLKGSRSGLTASGSTQWSESSAGVPGAARRNDLFGATVVIGSFGRGGYADLVVGLPAESVSGHVGAGSVRVLYGTTRGTSGRSAQTWSQNSPGVRGVAETSDDLGSAFAGRGGQPNDW